MYERESGMPNQHPHEPDTELLEVDASETARQRAKEELNRAKRDIEAWLKIAAALESGTSLDAARLLSRSAESLHDLAPALRTAATAIEAAALEQTVAKQARQARLHYRERLEQALDAAKLRRQGAWPSYRIGDVVRVEIAFASAPERIRALVNGKAVASAEPGRVVAEAQARLDELLGRPFSADAFARELRELIAGAQSTSGGWADIRALHAALRGRMLEDGRDRDYGEAKFTADLYRLLNRQSGESSTPASNSGSAQAEQARLRPNGLASEESENGLELSPAPHARDGIYVPAPGGGNFIAAIRFVRFDHSGHSGHFVQGVGSAHSDRSGHSAHSERGSGGSRD